jgi:hypothetical protein
MIISNRAFCLIFAAILSYVLLLLYFPAVAAFVCFSGVGVAILVTVYNCIRKGKIGVNLRYKLVVYERRDNPIAFWFYTFLGVCFGSLSCVAAVLFLLHKFQGQG